MNNRRALSWVHLSDADDEVEISDIGKNEDGETCRDLRHSGYSVEPQSSRWL
jgi:hypothetical protein